jgi:hypothetical protein
MQDPEILVCIGLTIDVFEHSEKSGEFKDGTGSFGKRSH